MIILTYMREEFGARRTRWMRRIILDPQRNLLGGRRILLETSTQEIMIFYRYFLLSHHGYFTINKDKWRVLFEN